tara:strand:- start:122 stop:550 length:429 start_codon:yes stop_codon:yes gene_type:complete
MNCLDYKAAGIILFSEKGEVYMAVDKKQRVQDFGGKKIPEDLEQPHKTAIRECEEECGIVPNDISYSNSIYLANSKYYLFFAMTNDIPIPQNEIEIIKKFQNIDSIDIPLNPRLWGHKWIVQAKNWLLENKIVRPALRTVWQ